MTKLEPLYPGEMLKKEFLEPLSISHYQIAKDINIPATRISQIIKGKRSISANTALHLAHYFGNSPEF